MTGRRVSAAHPTDRGIHRRAIKRLTAAWVALSLLAGGAVFYVEVRKAEDLVLKMALDEAGAFAAHVRPGADHHTVLKQKAVEYLKRHMVVIKLYRPDGREVLRAVAPGFETVEARLTAHPHLPASGDSIRHSSAFIQQRVLMHVLLPLSGRAGYFEGVYRVDDETIANIRNDVLGALALVVLVTLITTVALYPVIVSLNRGLIQYAKDLLKGNIELMQVLGSAVALRDSDTGTHNHRVTLYAVRLAEAVGLDRAQFQRLIAGAFLHDVGKIGVSDTILLKRGRHSEEETRVMRTHVPLGVEILNKSEWLQHARDVVECHHEKYDGSGYPRGLQGEAIPMNARIFAITDVFDALVARRPYKEPFGFDDAMGMLARERGLHFDPALLDAFTRIAPAVYAEIHATDEATLRRTLDKLVERYFS